VTIYTIGFTQRTAEDFFETLKRTGVTRLIDARLNNISQLAGYSKKDDLRYFLQRICGADYHHELTLAPTKEMLDAYRGGNVDWADYEPQFRALLKERKVERKLARALFEGKPVLLCSEFKPEHCHRKIVAEYLAKAWGGIAIVHL